MQLYWRCLQLRLCTLIGSVFITHTHSNNELTRSSAFVLVSGGDGYSKTLFPSTYSLSMWLADVLVFYRQQCSIIIWGIHLNNQALWWKIMILTLSTHEKQLIHEAHSLINSLRWMTPSSNSWCTHTWVPPATWARTILPQEKITSGA